MEFLLNKEVKNNKAETKESPLLYFVLSRRMFQTFLK